MDTLPPPSLESQVIYRLASMEATLTNSIRRIDEKIDNFQKDFNHKHTNVATQIAAVDARSTAEKLELEKKVELVRAELHDRVTKLEFFKTEILAKATAVAFGVGLLWMLLGDTFKHMLGIK